ncbi:hypothetical protein PG985_009988 [Apiospora marii]|uniref:uncharacterized protein n=1 Tax=Apiospora marii TaxID=335849 RepID=UPI00312EDE23
MAVHSLLWAALPFLSLINPSIQASGTLRVDDEHRGTVSVVTATGTAATGTATGAATPTPIPLLGTQSEPVAVDGAYLIAFKDSYRYDDGFLTKLSTKLGIQATLRIDLTGEAFNGVSIQINQDVDDANDAVDTPTKIAALEEVVAVSPMREHPRPETPREFSPRRRSEGLPPLPRCGAGGTVNEAYETGWTGKGQKIAIIDAWPDDKDDPDPECKSHATALAGVIAAQEAVSGIRGVAPGVQLGSYAISGCRHGGNDEKLLQALDQGLRDGVTAVVYSMGSVDGWSNEALDLAFDRASRRGLLIAVSAGNHGGGGIFKTSRPAEAAEVLGVGAVDNTQSYTLGSVSTYTTDQGSSSGGEFVWRDGEPGSGATGWKGVVMPLWSKLNKDDLGEHCANLFPADVPDLSKYIVLLPRPRDGRYCSDIDMAARAGDKGAVYVLMVDGDLTQRIEIVRVDTPSLRAIAMTNQKQGDAWLELLNSGAEVTVNMTALPDKTRVLVNGPQERGGRMSSFSAWGPTYDGFAPTSVSAPGDSLLTTRSGGGWVVTGGTSLSTPFAAAVAALVAEARGTKDWKILRSLLSTTASPLIRAAPADIWDQPGLERASIAQQGAGLVQAMNAIRAPCEIDVHKILFNDTDNRQTASFTIRNPTSDAITYELGNIPAGTVHPFVPDTWWLGNYNDLTNNGLYTSDAAALSFPKTGARVTVPGGGGSATIEVTASDPHGVNKTRLPVFSGWLSLNGSDGFDYRIPYIGLAGSIDATPTMHTLAWERQDGSPIAPGGAVELSRRGGDTTQFPNLVFKVALAPRQVVTELRDAATGDWVDDLPMYFGQMAYNNGGGWGWLVDFKNGSKVPDGEYVAVARSQAAFMSGGDRSEWQEATSPPLKIKWTG